MTKPSIYGVVLEHKSHFWEAGRTCQSGWLLFCHHLCRSVSVQLLLHIWKMPWCPQRKPMVMQMLDAHPKAPCTPQAGSPWVLNE